MTLGGAGDWGPSRNSFHQRDQRSRIRASLGFFLLQTKGFVLKQDQITRELMDHDKKSAKVHQAEAPQEMCHMTTKSFFSAFIDRHSILVSRQIVSRALSYLPSTPMTVSALHPSRHTLNTLMALPYMRSYRVTTSYQRSISHFAKWRLRNWVSFPTHTCSMKAKCTHHPIHINNIAVRRIDHHKYLGFTLDNTLNVRIHTTDIQKHDLQRLLVICEFKVLHLLPVLYQSLIQLILLHCSPSWKKHWIKTLNCQQ